MLRQNRYKTEDFYNRMDDLDLNRDEITVSSVHQMVIALEPEQVKNYSILMPFILNVISNIPFFDNVTQDYYEEISEDRDFPHTLEVIYVEEDGVRLDYWSEECNSQFGIIFAYEDEEWRLKEWSGRTVPQNWLNR